MKRSDRQNALVVSAIALCFMLTLGLSYFLAGEGFLLAFNQSEADEKCYLLCAGSYENAELARNAAELVRSRGGAGYVMTKERAEVVLAAYKSREDAEKVVESGSAGGGAYILEVPVGEVSVSWAEESLRDAAKSALGYFDIVFDCLYETANGVAEGVLTLLDARTRVAVCRVRVEEMREDFLSRARDESGAECTELKLALVTAVALLENTELADAQGEVKAVSSLRYQCVQLVLCREALFTALGGEK